MFEFIKAVSDTVLDMINAVYHEKPLIEFCSVFQVSKTLAKSTLDKLSATQTTLPEDLQYDADNFPKFFLKPAIKVSE